MKGDGGRGEGGGLEVPPGRPSSRGRAVETKKKKRCNKNKRALKNNEFSYFVLVHAYFVLLHFVVY